MFGNKKSFAVRSPWRTALGLFLFLPLIAQDMGTTEPSTAGQEKAGGSQLPVVLNKALRYCRRLEKAALDFVCLEEITEKIDYSRDREDEIYVPLSTGIRTQIKIAKRKQENTYLYDFQFTRKDEFKKENRILLEKNGRKGKEKEAPLETSVFQVRNVLFGPLGLLSEYRQGYHDYRLIGEEGSEGGKVAIVDATPKATLTGAHAYGRIWIKEGDGSVLKIEWAPKSLPDIANLEVRAERYRSALSVSLVTEYGIEKNGLRFPSRDISEEAYLGPGGEKFIRSRTAVVYRDYRFFTVETDVRY